MSEPQLASEQQQFVQSIYAMAAEQMRAGSPSAAIEKNLMEPGLDAESARAVVGNLSKAMTQAQREAGQTNMFIGALFCIGGAAVTFLSGPP